MIACKKELLQCEFFKRPKTGLRESENRFSV